MEDELLLESKSLSLPLAVAVFTIWPDADGVTTMDTTALAPTARLPKPQLTVLVPLHAPCVADDETNVRPAGNVSMELTLVAAAGPLLVTTMR